MKGVKFNLNYPGADGMPFVLDVPSYMDISVEGNSYVLNNVKVGAVSLLCKIILPRDSVLFIECDDPEKFFNSINDYDNPQFL